MLSREASSFAHVVEGSVLLRIEAGHGLGDGEGDHPCTAEEQRGEDRLGEEQRAAGHATVLQDGRLGQVAPRAERAGHTREADADRLVRSRRALA